MLPVAIAQRAAEAEAQLRAVEVAKIARANRDTRQRHHAEVLVRREEERQFYEGVSKCYADRDKALVQYQNQVRKAIGDHITVISGGRSPCVFCYFKTRSQRHDAL